MHLDPLWVVAPFKDVALGNTPPGVRFEAEGATHQGPPKGISAVVQRRRVSTPLTLHGMGRPTTAIRAPEARTRSLIPSGVRGASSAGPAT